MFLSKWFVPLVRIPSNPRLDLRLVMVWLLIPLQKVQLKVLEDFKLTLTVTTEELLLKTLCEFYFKLNTWGGKPPLFLFQTKTNITTIKYFIISHFSCFFKFSTLISTNKFFLKFHSIISLVVIFINVII